MRFILSSLILCLASAAFANGHVYHCQLPDLSETEAAFSIDARSDAEKGEYRIQYSTEKESTTATARIFDERISFSIPTDDEYTDRRTEHTFVLDSNSLEVTRITKSVSSSKADQIRASIARGSCSESESITYIPSKLLCDTNALDGNLDEQFYLNEKLGRIEINYLSGLTYTPEQHALGNTISLSHELASSSSTETIERIYRLDLIDLTISTFDKITPIVEQMEAEGAGFGLGVCTSTF